MQTGLNFSAPAGDYNSVVQHPGLFRRRLRLRDAPMLLLRHEFRRRLERQCDLVTLYHRRSVGHTAVHRSTTQSDRRTYHTM